MTEERVKDRNQLITDSGSIGGAEGSNILVAAEPTESAATFRRLAAATERVANSIGKDPASDANPSQLSTTTTTSGADVFTGTVLTYIAAGTGTATVNSVTQSFTNSTGISLLTDDVILLTKKGSTYYAIGLISRSGVGYPTSSTASLFTPTNAVPGLPYQPLTTMSIFGAADGCVWASTGAVVSYSDAQSYTITRPSTSWDHMWGLSDDPNGVWVFVNRSVTSNGLHVIYNGSGTTHNYGACQVLGTHDGKIWCWAGRKSGSIDRRLISINSTGTVADYTNAALSVLADTANGTVGRAGPWGIVLWDSADVVTVSMSSGAPNTYTQYLIGVFPSLQTGSGAHIFSTCMSNNSFFYMSSTTNDRDYRRWNLGSATLSTFLDVLPVGFTHYERIATTGGTTAVISGHNGADQQACVTSGSGVTVTTYTGTTHTGPLTIASTPTNEVIGAVRSDSTSLDTLIGIS